MQGRVNAEVTCGHMTAGLLPFWSDLAAEATRKLGKVGTLCTFTLYCFGPSVSGLNLSVQCEAREHLLEFSGFVD